MGRKSQVKGAREERALVKYLQAWGFAAEKVSRAWKPGQDLSVPVLGIDRRVEVKRRATSPLYGWLQDRDILIVRADHERPLVVLTLDLAAEIALAAERSKAIA
jgi:Holliday junction resolvase